MRKAPDSSGTGHKDPRDASHVPPSVMREHIGEPEILHDDKHANHAGRHGSLSHQEQHVARGSGM